MKYIFIKKKESAVTYLLLHGTGGNEKDLIPILDKIDPHANVFGVLGEVSELGMARYFRRISEGVFDEEDLIYRTERLHSFVSKKCAEHQIEPNNLVVLGYSNGANMAQSLLLHYPNLYHTMILLHPMNVRKDLAFGDLSHAHIFIGAGRFDPICPLEESYRLESRLLQAKAQVLLSLGNHDHRITTEEIANVKKWIQCIMPRA